ncbi:MAG: YhdP family protein [Woeseia sp.]
MKKLLRKLVKYLVYLGTALVILLAVAVGLFRLFLPRLPEYQEEIKDWANAAIGMQVEFSDMDARWRLRGPELNFYDTELVSRDNALTVLNAEEVRVGVGLMRLLLDRQLVADRILIRDATIDVARDAKGMWRVQGIALDALADSRMVSTDDAGPLTVVGEDIRINFRLPDRAHPVAVVVDTVEFRRDELQHGFEASLALPESLGNRVAIAASQRLEAASPRAPWQVFVEGQALNIAGLSELGPAGSPDVGSGMADVSLWLDLSGGDIRSATANFTATDVVAGSGAEIAPFGAEGRVEYSRDVDGWLLSADDFILRTAEGAWRESSLQMRVLSARAGSAETVAGSASWFNLDDLHYVLPWLPEDQRELLEALAPSGVVRDFDISVTGADSAVAQFELSATMDRVGVAAYEDWPGIRGFSGAIRADRSGGRLEIHAGDMQLDLAGHLVEPVELIEADGTIIWRQNDSGTTLLSDSIRIRNADFDSTSSLQVIAPAAGTSPIVDLQSSWSVRDIGNVERYLPVNAVKPALYRWLSDALVAGNVPEGTTRFVGPLDKFPFDNGEGTFRIEARLENGTLRYSDQWPAAERMNLGLVVENTRLYSFENTATNAGNTVIDARIEIPDLRNPVLSIDGHAAGTLETIRRFSRESPIAGVFGGQLDRVTTEGEASFDLLLTYPILDRQNYAFTTHIRSENGTVRIEGLPSPISELNGIVTVTRDRISAESLSGRFLDGPVTIELARAGETQPSYSVIATAGGNVGAEELAQHFGAALSDLLDGSTRYHATVSFPRAGLEVPQPLTISVQSGLDGMAVNMPPPIGKTPDSERPVSFAIELPGEGRIETTGNLADEVRWTLDFARNDKGWDFDRGVLAAGGAEPGEPEIRGLHIEGRTPILDLDDWLALSRRDDARDGRPGFAERIRSIDLMVDDLYVIGQHLSQHRVIVNRSALDWAVQLDGDQAVGSLTIPYDFGGDRPLILEMQKLTLPGGDEGAAVRERRPDPRALPQITVTAEDFSLGDRHLGRLQADFVQTEAGLRADAVVTSNDTFEIRGRAGWIVDESDSTGQRSYVAARLTSSNVEETLRDLDYDVGIESESLDAQFDLSWSGGPREDFLDSLDGTVGVRFGTGQLDEVEPGAGRVFGLMSIVALPRRLSLDFRDVFDKGFGFDEITGTFRLDDGEAYTCDLSLKGPAADVGIVGRTGLVAKDYDQTAVVSANVGNTLPVVGAVVAGPQVAAALLIFSQIFKKPLQEMGQIYYGIEGGWDNPAIDGADAQRFAGTSALAGCLSEEPA